MQSFSAILQSSSAIDEPRNPSDVRFVGWALSNGEPLVGQEQDVNLHQLASAAHIVHTADHSYADNSTNDRTMAQRINTAPSIFLAVVLCRMICSCLLIISFSTDPRKWQGRTAEQRSWKD